MKVLPNGVAVCGSTHHAQWCETEGLEHDKFLPDIIRKELEGAIGAAIDVGAHIGTLTRTMLDAGVDVYAFEPNPEAIACLRINAPEACAYQVGLSDKIEQVFLNQRENAGASYLSATTGETLVLTIPLDSLRLENISLIKIDAEGYEVRVLKGAEQTIAQSKPKLILEVNRGALARQRSAVEDLFCWLKDHDYKNSILQPDVSYSDPIYDVLALPK